VTLDLERDLERAVADERLRSLGPLLEAADELPRAPARRHDPVVLVEDDDDLPALLDERPPAPRLEAELVHTRVEPRGLGAASLEQPHFAEIVARSTSAAVAVALSVTTSSQLRYR
jgi:hypothetical protein